MITFTAPDYYPDQTFATATYRFEGSAARGWTVFRNGVRCLALGPGYRLLRTLECGVCSTDLARHHLPFPLPQVIGHEIVATDDEGQRYVVEINASHRARGVATDCLFCRHGLERHCPERLVLGIHDLPGGFGPYVLVPEGAAIPVPDEVPTDAAVLVEPFAAALRAVERVAPRNGDKIAVLGPGRLGLLVVAALAAWRRQQGLDFEIVALARRQAMLDLARDFGAMRGELIGAEVPTAATLDVVIDTTGSPGGLAMSVGMARREVHLKSTHGQPAAGLSHLTELVVDELSLGRLPEKAPAPGTLEELFGGVSRPRIAWLAGVEPPSWLTEAAELLRGGSARELLVALEQTSQGLPRAAAAVVDTPALVDAAIRPSPDREVSLVRPGGWILLDPTSTAVADSPLLQAILARGLRATSSRCGDFRQALAFLSADPECRTIVRRLITHRFHVDEISRAFETARSPACIKAAIRHGRSA